MLQIRELTLTHKKDFRILLEDFHMVLNDGDKAVIIGEEGNGKSTLMKYIYSPEMVEDYIEAKGIRALGKERLGYLPQEIPIKEQEETLYEFFSQRKAFGTIRQRSLQRWLANWVWIRISSMGSRSLRPCPEEKR